MTGNPDLTTSQTSLERRLNNPKLRGRKHPVGLLLLKALATDAGMRMGDDKKTGQKFS